MRGDQTIALAATAATTANGYALKRTGSAKQEHICDACRRVSAYDWVGERERRVRDDGAQTFR